MNISKRYWIIVYFDVFFVLPDSVWFSTFYSEIPAFYPNILYSSLYLYMPSLYVIHGWSMRVARLSRGVGCDVGQGKKEFSMGGHKNILARNLLRQS